jgi:uncharacterized repeat protein (TIGR01451 family)
LVPQPSDDYVNVNVGDLAAGGGFIEFSFLAEVRPDIPEITDQVVVEQQGVVSGDNFADTNTDGTPPDPPVTQTIVTIYPNNAPPVITAPASVPADVGQVFSFLFNVSDPEGDAYTLNIDSPHAVCTPTQTTAGSDEWQAVCNDDGTGNDNYDLLLQVTDDRGAVGEVTVAVVRLYPDVVAYMVATPAVDLNGDGKINQNEGVRYNVRIENRGDGVAKGVDFGMIFDGDIEPLEAIEGSVEPPPPALDSNISKDAPIGAPPFDTVTVNVGDLAANGGSIEFSFLARVWNQTYEWTNPDDVVLYGFVHGDNFATTQTDGTPPDPPVTQTIVTIYPNNAPPAITTPASVPADWGQEFSFQLSVSDPEGDAYTLNIESPHAVCTPARTTAGGDEWIAVCNDDGAGVDDYDLLVHVTDERGAVIEASVPVDRIYPVIQFEPISDQAVEVNATLTFDVIITHPNPDEALTVDFSELPPFCGDQLISQGSYQVTCSPTNGDEGLYTFSLSTTDLALETSVQTVNLEVMTPLITAEKVGVINDTNGDGRLNPGETIDFTITIHNTGKGVARNVRFEDLLHYGTPSLNPFTLIPLVGEATTTQGTIDVHRRHSRGRHSGTQIQYLCWDPGILQHQLRHQSRHRLEPGPCLRRQFP